jgi:hypothetical protein
MRKSLREIMRKKQNHQCAKHTSKTTSKCKQKIQFQILTLTIKTSCFTSSKCNTSKCGFLKKKKNKNKCMEDNIF